ncbi:hypothetical protein BU16DRAFT_509359 [Lophium mytilinum]|uniref:BTB domain-containing protein n=1 Tax=Lophium mytilinum TaxID=390894 RepID=A0A6A6QVY2_9PEZI|nr:hypothetical protein BU16DRAFT_509359 [Lophium mytilinum]
MNSDKYSDLEIRCGEISFKAHRVILCSQVRFFDKACSSGFKEATDGVIDLSHDDSDAVRAMLEFAYTASYPCPKGATSERLRALHEVAVYGIGHKYEIPSLQEHALGRFCCFVSSEWEQEYFPDVVRAIYESTPSSDRGLRDYVVNIMVSFQEKISKQDRESPIQKLLAEIGEFSRDCYVGVGKGLTENFKIFQKALCCTSCGKDRLLEWKGRAIEYEEGDLCSCS